MNHAVKPPIGRSVKNKTTALSLRLQAFFVALVLVILASVWLPADEIDFQRDIRPILSDACFQCHGPDEEQREADFRLDTREGLFADGGDGPRVTAGKPKESALYLRLTHDDPDQRMPPADEPRQLTDTETELIRRWIESGATWNQLWSFVLPQRPTLPAVSRKEWLRNPLDTFVLAKLDDAKLKPKEEATSETLLRRVALDLTGLPPQLEQLDTFLADTSPAAYERAVDRLLASPRHGERMSIEWLNAARYADTSGYQMDGPRQMWRWRDWVIDAFNAGMPFDQFTIEQCAGDLLSNPTLEQLIATAFNRNHRGNAEGGIISEEYRVEYVVDRVETTSTVWLGLTLGCARCHDHKYDPITQEDFYQFFAFFNNVPERGKARKWGNARPNIKAPTPIERQMLGQLDDQIGQTKEELQALETTIRKGQEIWEKQSLETFSVENSFPKKPAIAETLIPNPVVHFTLDNPHLLKEHNRSDQVARWEGEPEFGPGRIELAGQFDGNRYVEVGDLAAFDYEDPFSISAWVFPEGDQGGAIVSRMQSDTDERKGYSLELTNGRFHINLVRRWLDDCLRVRSVAHFTPGQWYHVVATYDGSKVFAGAQLYVDGKPHELEIIVDDLQQPFSIPDPLRIGSRGTHLRFHGRIDDVQLFDLPLSEQDVRTLSVPEPILELLAIPRPERSDRQRWKLRQFYLKFHATPTVRYALTHLSELQAQRKQLYDQVSTVMVMQEMEKPRDTFILQRGRYDQPSKRVHADVPDSLPPLPENINRNRLNLAHWLLDPANPLTTRVAVNRIWQAIFGQGLVRTPEDFGSQGEKPSHPALLDWLATEFRRTNWDRKGMARALTTSATYRQSSTVTADSLQADPENRLLSRGSRYRLPAEMIRDLALATSGLLVEQIGGPSVKPYQPAGLWVELTLEKSRYVQDTGSELYRRSLYTYWKRTVAPPGMLVMDAPQRETCSVRVSRTNTPLQALNLMNDITYVESARALAERVLKSVPGDDADRLQYAFRLVTSRKPRAEELKVLQTSLTFHRDYYKTRLELGEELVGFGDSEPDHSLATLEVAAYTVVMNLLLNLDETITRE